MSPSENHWFQLPQPTLFFVISRERWILPKSPTTTAHWFIKWPVSHHMNFRATLDWSNLLCQEKFWGNWLYESPLQNDLDKRFQWVYCGSEVPMMGYRSFFVPVYVGMGMPWHWKRKTSLKTDSSALGVIKWFRMGYFFCVRFRWRGTKSGAYWHRDWWDIKPPQHRHVRNGLIWLKLPESSNLWGSNWSEQQHVNTAEVHQLVLTQFGKLQKVQLT